MTSDLNITPEREAFSGLADNVADDIRFYLERLGISVTRSDVVSDGLTRLEVILRSRYKRYSGNFRIDTKLISGDGTLIDETFLYHVASSSSPTATSQQLAEVIVDDVLLMWHPAKDVLNGKPPKHETANALTGLQVSVDQGQSRFTWEEFPSARLLLGADFSAAEVSDVQYELRIKPYSFKPVRGPAKGTRGIHRVRGLLKAEHTLAFSLPSCEEARWSVRAHFRLGGAPRVTEWSRHRAGGRKFVPRRTRTTSILFHQIGSTYGNYPIEDHSTEEISCHRTERQPSELLPQLDIEALQTGQSIAAMAWVSQYCDDENCEVRMTTEKAGKDVISDSNGLATIITPETYYESKVDSRLFDILNGEVAATIGSSAKGAKGMIVPMILFIPVAVIPYGSKNRIENRACDAMARRLALGLKGGVSGWPEGFFVDPIEASWDYGEIE